MQGFTSPLSQRKGAEDGGEGIGGGAGATRAGEAKERAEPVTAPPPARTRLGIYVEEVCWDEGKDKFRGKDKFAPNMVVKFVAGNQKTHAPCSVKDSSATSCVVGVAVSLEVPHSVLFVILFNFKLFYIMNRKTEA